MNQRAREIFYAALDRQGDERNDFVENACRGAPPLLEEVRALLSNLEESTSFLETPCLSTDRATLEPGTTIDDFTIEGLHAAGGMGVVFLARQKSPNRRVALKLVRPESFSDSTLRRFALEAELLGSLQHPGIARVLRAGMVETVLGRQPYMALEFVEGRHLDGYARDKGLSIRERLWLFLDVADALCHAHQKGVLHRDLKPSNILVDDEGHPKILDFGVARRVDAEDVSFQTQTGQLVGTLPYMSPEQVSGDPRACDTRSDVYSLGVVLYELLSGHLPHDLAGLSITRAANVIREETAKPFPREDPQLQGDLETIVGMALAKESSRRYQSVRLFADDIRRYLRGEPILAREPSTWYLARKFAGRHRTLVGAAAIVLVALVSFLVSAVESWNQVVRKNEVAEATVEALETILRTPNPFAEGRRGTIPRSTTVLELLRNGFETLPESYRDEPELEWRVRHLFGQTLTRLEELDTAETHLVRATALSEGLFGERSLRTGETLLSLALLRSAQGRPEEAEDLQRRALEILDESEASTRDRLDAQSNLALFLWERGELEEAEPILRDVLRRKVESFGARHPETADSIHNLASFVLDRDRLEEAEALIREALSIRIEEYGQEHPKSLTTQNELADYLRRVGRHDESATLYREILDKTETTLGSSHVWHLTTMSNLAVVEDHLGHRDSANELNRQAYEGLDEALGSEHPMTLRIRNNLVLTYIQSGRFTEAASLSEGALEASEAAFGERHPDLMAPLQGRFGLAEATQDWESAERYARRCLEICRDHYGLEHLSALTSTRLLALALHRLNRSREALNVLEEAWDVAFGLEDPHRLVYELGSDRSTLLADIGEVEEAELALSDVYELAVENSGPVAIVLERLIRFYTRQGMEEEAAEYRSLLRGLPEGED